jgi:hypothetical protein
MAPPDCQLCEDTAATLHCKQCQENFCQEVSALLLLLLLPGATGSMLPWMVCKAATSPKARASPLLSAVRPSWIA